MMKKQRIISVFILLIFYCSLVSISLLLNQNCCAEDFFSPFISSSHPGGVTFPQYPIDQTTFFTSIDSSSSTSLVQKASKRQRLVSFVETDKSVYFSEEPVIIIFTVKNEGDGPLFMDFSSPQQFDAVVKSDAGVMWRLSLHMPYDLTASSFMLAPGEEKTFEIQWNQQDNESMSVPFGIYKIEVLAMLIDTHDQTSTYTYITIKDLPKFTSCQELKRRLRELIFQEEPHMRLVSLADESFSDGSAAPSEVLPVFLATKSVTDESSDEGPFLGEASPGGSGSDDFPWSRPPWPLPTPGTKGGTLLGTQVQALYTLPAMAPALGFGVASSFGVTSRYAPAYVGAGLGVVAGYAPAYGGAGSGGASVLSPAFPGTAGYGLTPISVWSYSSGSDSVFNKVSNTISNTSFNTTYSSSSFPFRYRRGKSSMSNANDYSMTTTLIAGVDEGDSIKNDGIYIYMIKGKNVRIIRGMPSHNLTELPPISYEDTSFTPTFLYINKDTLIVVGEEPCGMTPMGYADGTVVMSYYRERPAYTRIFIYDITDRSQIVQKRTIKFGARYVESRKVDHTLYLIMNDDPPYYLEENLTNPQDFVPMYSDSSIHSEDEGDLICECNKVAYFPDDRKPYYFIIVSICLDDPEKEIGRRLIVGGSENIYWSTKSMYVTSTISSEENRDTHSMVVYKFRLDNESVTYAGHAEMGGVLTDQLSLDEYNDQVRIAVTKESSSGRTLSLLILDERMKLKGIFEDIAPRDQIESVRFIGSRAYMVESGPPNLFSVISLENQADPKISGQLMISGSIEYLHPYDEYRIISFGREVVDGIEEGVTLTLFDVSDMHHPVKVYSELIGSMGTNSPVLDDHKALVMSPEKNLMAFPIVVTQGIEDYHNIFKGSHIYSIDKNGFEKITEIPDESIERILYMGDHYYVVSESKITAIGMHTYTEDASISLKN